MFSHNNRFCPENIILTEKLIWQQQQTRVVATVSVAAVKLTSWSKHILRIS